MHQLSRRRTKWILRWGCTLFVGMIDRTCMPISGERVHLFVKVYTSIIIYKGVTLMFSQKCLAIRCDVARRGVASSFFRVSNFECTQHSYQLPATSYQLPCDVLDVLTGAMVCEPYRKAAFITGVSKAEEH